MGSVFKNRQINSPFGIFFQKNIFIIGAFGVLQLLIIFALSLTDFNGISTPSFIGLENYLNVFKEEIVRQSLGSTVITVFFVALLLLFTAVLPALFISRLKLPFGVVVIGAFSFISISAMLPNFFNTFFNSGRYGILNGFLLNCSIISEPISFTMSYAGVLSVIIIWLYCLAPVFIITYIFARMKHGFLGSAIAICIIPVLMYLSGGVVANIVGSPSIDYSANSFYSVFNEYLTVRFCIGFAYAILIVGLIMLTFWCVLVSFVTLGVRCLCKKVKINVGVCKTGGCIFFSLALLSFFAVLGCLIVYLLRAFMPLEELFVYPNIYIPRKPTLENFYNLFERSGAFVSFSSYLSNSLWTVPLVIMPICIWAALPSGVGFSLFKSFKKQNLLLFCFIPFLFASNYITFAYVRIVDTKFAYAVEFLSSFEFLTAVFLVYLTVKLSFYDLKFHKSSFIVGIFFIITSFYAIGAIRGIWYRSYGVVYSEELKLWSDIASIIQGGAANGGIAAANDMLMLLATAAVVIVPLVLLLILYLIYRKSTENLKDF